MELLIIKGEHVFARATDGEPAPSTEYRLMQVGDMPPYPAEDAGHGKYWDVDLVDGMLEWVRMDRPLTAEERVEEVERRMDELEYPAWVQPQGAHDAYTVGAKVSHIGKRWISTVDANVWEPSVYGWDTVR